MYMYQHAKKNSSYDTAYKLIFAGLLVCPHKRLDEKVMQLHLRKTAHAILKTYLCYITHHKHCTACFL